jgi:hypothetical protein
MRAAVRPGAAPVEVIPRRPEARNVRIFKDICYDTQRLTRFR